MKALSIGLVVSIMAAMPAGAHDWYDEECCDSRQHCEPVSDGAVRETAGGFVVPSGEQLAYADSRIHLSHDTSFHWCHWQKAFPPPERGRPQTGFDLTICLYAPPRSY